MQLFYSSELISGSKTFIFDKEESKHIVKVLRKKEGDEVFITNGCGYLFSCKITFASEKKCEVIVESEKYFEPNSYYLHIAVSPTKMNDRIEWFLEKATEIGVHEITPIITDNSERKDVKTERFEKIVLSAMKQSLQFYLPKINPIIKFKDFVKQDVSLQKFIAHCEETDKKEFVNEVNPKGTITIMIGPEGDFSNAEIKTAISVGYNPVALGNTRLRTETAALMACSMVAIKKIQS